MRVYDRFVMHTALYACATLLSAFQPFSCRVPVHVVLVGAASQHVRQHQAAFYYIFPTELIFTSWDDCFHVHVHVHVCNKPEFPM